MGRSRIRVLFASLAVALACTASASVPGTERAALVAIHQATNGAAWFERSGWLGAEGSECSWSGVRCDASQSTVTGLVLADNNLTGTLPPEIGALANLTELDLAWNDLGGAVPAQLAALTKLERLDLSDNHFEGPLPSSLFAISALTSLRLGGNRFAGEIPQAIGGLINVVTLDLSNNQLRGEPPATFQSLTSLRDGELDLRYNAIRLSGGSVRSFLERKQAGGDILGTQTLPPKNVKGQASLDAFAKPGDFVVSWDLPAYTSDPGGYQVTTVATGTSEVRGVSTTASKEYADIILTGMEPGYLSYFVRTVTYPHGRQQNTLTSDAADPTSQEGVTFAVPTARPVIGVFPETIVQSGPEAAQPITFTVLNLGTFPSTLTLSRSGNFFLQGPDDLVVQPGESETITIFPNAKAAGTYEGSIIVTGDGAPDGLVVPVKLVSTAPLDGSVVGQPPSPRIDVSVARGTNPIGSATFRNLGTTTLHGVARSDVEWLLPQAGAVTIPPGESRSVGFLIDRSKRPDASKKNGTAFSGALRLDYVDPEAEQPNARSGAEATGGSSAATSLVSVVDTVPPPVRGTSVPALVAGETALFIPGLEHRLRSIGELLSDLSIANAFGVASIADVRLYFSPIGSVATSSVANMGAVAPRGSILLSDVVNTVYAKTESAGSLQLRSSQAGRLLTGARLVTVKPGRGTLGTTLPVFLSTRATKAGEEIRLAGIRRGASEADLIVQETSGAPASVKVEYFDALGASVAIVEPVAIEPFGTASYIGSVPERAATAIITNRGGSAGRIVAYGRNLDAGVGDLWVVNDWSRLSGFDPASAQMIVYAPLSGIKETRRRPVRRGTASLRDAEAEGERTTLELTIHNPGLSTAGALLTYHENGTAIGPKTISLAGRETRTVDDAVGSLFGLRGTSTGWISIEPRRGVPLAVSARVVTSGAAPSTATVPVAALSSGLRLGQTQLFAGIDDARQATVDERLGGTTATTLGFAESAGKNVTVRVTMVLFDGSLLAARVTSKEFTVGANRVLLVPHIARAILGDERESEIGDLRDIQLEIRVVAGEGAVTPFVIATDNGSGDELVRLE